MRKINKIIVHCTDSDWGNIEVINQWHQERGFNCIGYHFVIGNAYPTYSHLKNRRPDPEHDGAVLEGRGIQIPGAHARGHNRDSIGVALVGKNVFSARQIEQLLGLLTLFMRQFHLPARAVLGHYEVNAAKSCPNLDMDWLRGLL